MLSALHAPTRGLFCPDCCCRLRARRGPSDVCDLPVDPVRRVPARSSALDETGSAARERRAGVACRARCVLPGLVAPDRRRHPVGLSRPGRGRARVRAVPGAARHPLGDEPQPRSRGLHEKRSGRGRGAPAHSAGRVRRAPRAGPRSSSGGRSRYSRSCSSRCSSRSSPISSRSRRHGARRLPPVCVRLAGGLAVLSRVLWPWLPPVALVAGAVLRYYYPVTSTTPSTIPAPRGWCGSRWSARGCARRRLRASKPASVEDTAGGRRALPAPRRRGRLKGGARSRRHPLAPLAGLVEYVRRTWEGSGCTGSGDELSDRRSCARLRRGRAARPCRRHDGEPAARAARDAREFLRTGDLGDRRDTAPSTWSSIGRGRMGDAISTSRSSTGTFASSSTGCG